MLFYLALYIGVAIWLFIDSKNRLFEQGKWWAIATAILGPVTAPIYLAIRPLKSTEKREGGRAWNILRNFALFWTITMFVAGIGGMASASSVVSEASNEYEEAGATIGAAIGMGLLFFLWLVPMVGAVALGFFLKNSDIEQGPTGPLVDAKEGDYSLKNFVDDAKSKSLDAVEKAKGVANYLKAKHQAQSTAKSPPPLSTPTTETKIPVTCQCGAIVKAKASLAGKTVKCPKCNGRLTIPALPE